MKIVFDTNVVVSAFLWRGAPRDLFFRAIGVKQIELYTSLAMLSELKQVLTRKKLASQLVKNSLTAEAILMAYARQCLIIHPKSVRGIVRDFKDDMVIGTALAAGSEWLVSGDNDLLSIKQFENLHIVSVAEMTEILTSIK